MLVAVTGDLVTGVEDAGQEGRVLAGGHAQDEEGGPDVDLRQQRQQRLGLPLQSPARMLPTLQPNPPPYQLVPVLEVDAEQEGLCHDSADSLPQGMSRPFGKLVLPEKGGGPSV
jgi:hypothetical protein